MWKAFTSSDDGEPKSHIGYFRPRIASISGAIHSFAKHSFITEESFHTNRINGICLTGSPLPAYTDSSYSRQSLGLVHDLSYSRSASARASIDSNAAHAVYDMDHDGEKNSTIQEDNHNGCSNRTRKCSKGLLLSIIISITWVATIHLVKYCLEIGKERINFITNHTMDIIHNTTDYPIETLGVPLTSRPTGHIFYSKKKFPSTFDAPFFMAWFCSSWNTLFLPLFTVFRCLNTSSDKISAKKMLVESLRQFLEKEYSLLQFFMRCGLFCLLWIISCYLFLRALRILDCTVVVALYACSVSLIYLLSWVFLHQQFVGIRIVAVLVCDTGIALLAYMNGVDKPTIWNILLLAVAAFALGVFKVFYRRALGYTTFAQTALFFTLIGIMNILFMWPIVLLLMFFGDEVLSWSAIPWLPLSGAAVLQMISNLLNNFGLCWTYEIFLNLGLLFAIPISLVLDASLYNIAFKEMKLSGILLIMFGFIVVLLPDNWNHYLANILRSRLAKWKTREQLKNGARVQDTTTAALSRLRTPSGRVK